MPTVKHPGKAIRCRYKSTIGRHGEMPKEWIARTADDLGVPIEMVADAVRGWEESRQGGRFVARCSRQTPPDADHIARTLAKYRAEKARRGEPPRVEVPYMPVRVHRDGYQAELDLRYRGLRRA